MGSDYPFPLGEHHPGECIETHPALDAELQVRHFVLTIDTGSIFGRFHLL
jgi:hypothetical protein